MNYRHAYHAGNFADVFKHILIARMVDYLKRKDKAFRVYDLHAGLGVYSLEAEEAGKTEEWKAGIGALLAANIPSEHKKILGDYLDVVHAFGEKAYPGSPMVARKLLRKQDRLSLYELHPDDAPILNQNFAGDYQTRVNTLDGWLVPGAHVPPKEARGMMLIDPPFEDGKDFDRMIDAMEKARHRWAGGTVALWYPVKRRDHTDEWLGSLRERGFDDLMSFEIYIREPRPSSLLNGCGMVIANAPYTLRDEMGRLLPWLSGVLKQGKGAGHRIQNLSKS
ncbi:MAG: 23S rRNA (adenine(2030)-N(6))-methyltransferase RlmJ [Pseudomonadota bacterium]